ncbi:MAG: nitroreductase family deazaflavin-dependent oxidoreductase [Myxococcales bacterium]|nr:nitroreductase family deazaflavin-dependent oxidoreductase [Myxococcales bacterium]
MPNIRWLIALITRCHRWLFLTTDGRLGDRVLGFRFLLLEHVGRKTGAARKTPLLYIENGGRFLVAASNAGDPREPAWWLNLKSRPEAQVRLGRRTLAVKARAAEPEEQARLWPLLCESYSYFDRYRERAGRDIPVVLLEPTG